MFEVPDFIRYLMAFVCVCYETDEYYNLRVEFIFEKTVKLIS